MDVSGKDDVHGTAKAVAGLGTCRDRGILLSPLALPLPYSVIYFGKIFILRTRFNLSCIATRLAFVNQLYSL